MWYGGSRQLANRWEYAEGAGAGFVELNPKYTPTSDEFFQMLKSVPGITDVRWNSTKTSQRNVGRHYMERNIVVVSDLGPGSASHPMEFELTRNDHMKDSRVPFTVTASFKEPIPVTSS